MLVPAAKNGSRQDKYLWACNGFDRDHEAGEASRTGCVKFQN